MRKAPVNKIIKFSAVDGPGNRTAIFLQGCNFNCKYCHNPETWAGGGSQWTARQLFDKVYRYKQYWKDNGGITVSGGEPLLQIDFVTEFFKIAKTKKVNTAIDTAGQPFSSDEEWLGKFEELMKYTDLVILDLKEWTNEKHKALTGKGNDNIKEMAQWLSDHGKAMWIRHVLVPGLTDGEEDLKAMAEFISTLKTVEKVEILPYHALGIPKWEKIGVEYQLKDAVAPTDEEVARAEELLNVKAYS